VQMGKECEAIEAPRIWGALIGARKASVVPPSPQQRRPEERAAAVVARRHLACFFNLLNPALTILFSFCAFRIIRTGEKANVVESNA
jgi:hypothetical protein